MKPDPFKFSHDESTPPIGLPAPNCLHPEVQERLSKMETGIYDIRTALLGNKYQKGFVDRFDKIEEKVEHHDRKLLVWGSIMTVAGTVILFLKDFFHNSK